MKKFLIVLGLLLVLCQPGLAEKYEALPEIFNIEVKSVERKQDNNASFVYKEYLYTSNDIVNAEIASRVDAFDSEFSGTLQADPKGKGHRNSRLDIGVVYYRTGEKYLSTLVFARDIYYKETQSFAYNTALYDLETGDSIKLSQLIDDVEGFKEEIRQQINGLYPDQSINRRRLADFPLENLPFTMSGMELTVHVDKSLLFPDTQGILHARFFYPKFPYFNELGKAISDNSKWKLIALTFDDGPKDLQSEESLHAIRRAGIRATYFVVGKQMETAGYIMQRQAEENHIFGNHTYHHWNGYTFKKIENLMADVTKVDDLGLFILGEKLKYFRAPGGVYPPWADAKIGKPIIQWSVDTYDYTGKSAKKIFYSVRNNAKEGDIVLLHDTGHQTPKAIPLIGEWLTKQGFMAVTLEELEVAYGLETKPNEVYWSFREGENRETKQK